MVLQSPPIIQATRGELKRVGENRETALGPEDPVGAREKVAKKRDTQNLKY